MKKIFLTGATGYVGKAIIERFKKSYDIKAFTRSLGDIRNFQEVLKASEGSDIIIHMAAITPTTHPGAADQDVMEVNVEGTRNILDAAVKNKIKKVINFSSVCAVGVRPENYPIKEDAVCNPTLGAYGLSKLKGEELCREYSEKQGLDIICLRPAVVFPQHAFNPQVVDSVAWNIFVHIEDLLLMLKLALEDQKIKFGIYHIAPDNKYSAFDISLAKKELGYRPAYGFEKFIR